MAPPPSRCRTCLKDFKSNDIIVKLGTIEAFTMLSVAKKLQMCIPEVSLNEREEKNDALCSKCNYMLDVCCKFRNLCLKTQLKLDAIKKVPSKATPTAPTTTQSVASSAPEEPSGAKRKRVESNADTIQIIDDDDEVVETVQPANVPTNVVPAPSNIVPAPTNIVPAPTTNVVPAPTTNVVPAPANVLTPAVNGLAPVLPTAPFPFAPALPGFGVPQISYLKTDFGYIPIMNANVPLPQSVVHPLTEVLSTAAPAVNGGDKAPAAPATPVAPVTPVAPATPSTPAAQTATVAQKDPVIVIDDEEQPKVKDEPASDGEDNTELTAAADEPDDETAAALAAEDRNSPLLDILSEDRVDIIERATYSEPVERRMLVDRILKHNVHLGMYTPDQFECYVSIEPLPKKKKKKQVEYICQCNHCGNTFTSRSKLLTHIRMHFNYKPHQCPRCDESFYEAHELKAHELKSHPDVRKSLRKMEAESAKLAEKEKQQPQKYETRNKQVPPLKLQLNSRNSTPATAAATTAAPKDSGPPVLQQMEQPEENKSGKKESLSAIDKTLTRVLTGLLCRFCEVEFKTEKEAAKHFDLHCRICFRMVKDHKNHVRLHKMSRDEGGRKMYFCTTCKKNHRRIHFFVHTRVKPFHCYVCDRNYMTFNQFDKHQPECYPPPPVLTNQVDDDFEEEPKKASPAKEKKKVPPLKIKPLPPPPPPPVTEASKTCTLCRFTYKGEHRCYGRREFRCDACLKSFETVAGFQTHKCVNGGRTSTSCESCNKDFVCEEHGGEKLYKCEICQRQFQHNDFIEHMKVHIM